MGDKKFIYNGDLWKYNQVSLGSKTYFQSEELSKDFYQVKSFGDDFHFVEKVKESDLVGILSQEAKKLISQERIPIEAYF